MVQLVVVLGLLVSCCMACAGKASVVTSYGEITEATDTFPALDSTVIEGRAHPFFFFEETEIAGARARMADPRYELIVTYLDEQTRDPQSIELPRFETAWWIDEASAQPWSEIYPEIFHHTNRVPASVARPAMDYAMQYLLTGEDRYAETAVRLLRHLSSYSFMFQHYDAGLNYSVWATQVLTAYDAVFDKLTPQERAEMDGFFSRLGQAVLTNDLFWVENGIGGGLNNHIAWHKMMLGMLGAFYQRHAWVEWAMYSELGIAELLELGLVDDGLWIESSLNYHFTAIVPMVYLADTLRRTGHREDLFEKTFGNGRTLKQTLVPIVETLMPDHGLPTIGDTYGYRGYLSGNVMYDYGLAAYEDPLFAWVTGRVPVTHPRALFLPAPDVEPATPEMRSRLFPEHGYGVLRSRYGDDYFDSDAWCVFFNYDRNHVHSHYDGLSVQLFGGGRFVACDLEARTGAAHAFSSDVQMQLNRTALAQNTVMIDAQDQAHRPWRLELVSYSDLPDAKTIAAADTRGVMYPGVQQQRTVVLTDEYVLDVFEVRCDRERDIDWVTHAFGSHDDEAFSIGPLQPADPQPAHSAIAWIRDFKKADTGATWDVTWQQDGMRCRMTMLGAPGTGVVSCGFPTTDAVDSETVPMLIVRRRASDTVFVALYQVGRTELGPVKLVREDDVQAMGGLDGRIAFTVTGPWGTRRHSILRLR